MTVLPKIYLIQGEDAPQHSQNLQSILTGLITGNRISNFNIITWKEGVSLDQVVAGDMIVLLLTHALEPKKEEIVNSLRQLKNRDVKIAEIVIDNIPYDHEFITFPGDLKPIRTRDDMDAVWNGIEQQLKDIFPVDSKEEEPDIDPPGRSKWQKLMIALAVLLIVVLGWWLVGRSGSQEKKVPVIVSVSVGEVAPHTGNCPHQVEIMGKISMNQPGNVTYSWLRSNGRSSGEEETLTFNEAGETKVVTDSWQIGESGSYWQTLQILSPTNVVSDRAMFNVNCMIPLTGEDCIQFNSNNVVARAEGTGGLVTDGNSRMMVFRTLAKAREAVRIIRHYRLTKQCFAVRPNPGLKYFLAGDDIPSGSISGEDCIRINDPENLTIRMSSSTLYQILDGNHIPFSARSMEEARRIVEIVKFYKPNYSCYVERPDPGMIYIRK